MVVKTKEQVNTKEEQEDTTTPTSEAGTEGETEVSKEPEGEGIEESSKSAEEDEDKFEERLKDEYAKWQSKTLTPISKERDELRKQVADLNTKLEDRLDNKELDQLLQSETNELGEDEAKKLDGIRRKFNTRFKEYKEKVAHVEEAKKAADETAEKLGNIERHQMARERAYAILMPQDKEFEKSLSAIVEELKQADSPEHMERLAKLVVRERQGKQKPFHPSSARSSGGGVDLKTLSPLEKISRGLKEESKRR